MLSLSTLIGLANLVRDKKRETMITINTETDSFIIDVFKRKLYVLNRQEEELNATIKTLIKD